MRIVSWNCNMGFEKKRDVLMSLKPDIAVLQECSARDVAHTDAPFKYNHTTSLGQRLLAKGVQCRKSKLIVLGWPHFRGDHPSILS